MGTLTRKAQAAANKRAVLVAAPDQQAARKELRRMSDSWTRRHGSAGAYHKPGQVDSNLKPGRNRAHLVTSF